MADQCIVCLEDLDAVAVAVPDASTRDDDLQVAATINDPFSTHPSQTTNNEPVALIKPCNHVLHDECLRAWSQKANSCPICRQVFNLVEVLDKVGGTVVSEYTVEDKKQVAEFDPTAWVEEEDVEEEDGRPCPVCGNSDQEDVLLLCDGCDAPYHTHCIGLGDRIPQGHWFCMECEDSGAYATVANADWAQTNNAPISGRRAPRTQAGVRQSRRRLRNDHWVGAWSVISSRIHHASGVDLDFLDDDTNLADYRRHQRRTSDERREFQRWQQRLNIAGRQGAGAIFRAAAPARIIRAPTPVETKEETQAWGDFERAKEMDTKSPRNRKRKSRSVTTSPAAEPSEINEPERKLKRPRTRRILDRPEASGSMSVSLPGPSRSTNGHRAISPTARILNEANGEPSFLTSLLKEVEMNPGFDDDRSTFSATTTSGPNRVTSPSFDYSSPAASPTSSSPYHTPRASSKTPPPHISKRSGSPLPLTSRVEPIFPPADYSPNRSPPEKQNDGSSPAPEIRQPRPRRRRPVVLPRSEETSPTRTNLPVEVKAGISKIVKSALAPHWKSSELTKEQYEDINRAVSRKMYYDSITLKDLEDEKGKYEKIATSEVQTAIQALPV